MYGIGVDTTTISRIEKSMNRESFISCVFGENERKSFISSEKTKFPSLAANFAAKEAFSKALRTGVRGFNLNEVEILRDEIGAPYFIFSGRAKEIMQANNLLAMVSLTHEKDSATAFVVLYKK